MGWSLQAIDRTGRQTQACCTLSHGTRLHTEEQTFCLNPHLPCHYLSRGLQHLCRTNASTSSQSFLSPCGSALALHTTGVFSRHNPTPWHTLSTTVPWASSQIMLPLSSPAHKTFPTLLETLLPPTKGLCILTILIPP